VRVLLAFIVKKRNSSHLIIRATRKMSRNVIEQLLLIYNTNTSYENIYKCKNFSVKFYRYIGGKNAEKISVICVYFSEPCYCLKDYTLRAATIYDDFLTENLLLSDRPALLRKRNLIFFPCKLMKGNEKILISLLAPSYNISIFLFSKISNTVYLDHSYAQYTQKFIDEQTEILLFKFNYQELREFSLVCLDTQYSQNLTADIFYECVQFDNYLKEKHFCVRLRDLNLFKSKVLRYNINFKNAQKSVIRSIQKIIYVNLDIKLNEMRFFENFVEVPFNNTHFLKTCEQIEIERLPFISKLN
jgi:hypothetical protein